MRVHLRDDLASFEEKMLGIAILVHAAHGEDSQVVVRATRFFVRCNASNGNWSEFSGRRMRLADEYRGTSLLRTCSPFQCQSFAASLFVDEQASEYFLIPDRHLSP
jgi:hypothetical protein